MRRIIVIHAGNREEKELKNDKKFSELHDHPLLKEIEEEVKRLEHIGLELMARHAIASKLYDVITEVFGLSENSEKTAKKEKPKDPEPKENVNASEAKPKQSNRRLKMLEQTLKNAVAKLGNANMTSRFRQLRELHKKLQELINSGEGQDEKQRLSELESGFTDALEFFGTSKLAARFNLLKELRREFDEALNNCPQ